MARRRTNRATRILLRVLAALVLGFVAFVAWLWWDMRDWRPDIVSYPEQGALIASGQAGVRFVTLRAVGGQFVYLELREASYDPDPAFASRLAAAREAGLKIGVALRFDPCLRADPQSARFTRMVPRSSDLLPPAIVLQATGAQCPQPVSNAAVRSELLTLINQVEMHAGSPVLLKLAEEFEQRHQVANAIERDLWLERDRARPNYTGRPWLLWSANQQLVSEAAEDPIEWVVVQK